MIEINHNPSRRELRLFAGVWWPAGFAVVGLLVLSATGSWVAAGSVWGTALAVSVVGWFVPAFMRVAYVGMMYATFPIGWVVSHLLLAAVFFLIIAPIGATMRLCGRDPLDRRRNRSAKTYWVRRPPARPREDYFRQF